MEIKITGLEEVKAVLEAAPAALTKAIELALDQEAKFLLGEIKKAFRTIGPPNAASTIKQKGSSKPLVNHGDYKNAITVLKDGKGRRFIGVPRSSPEGIRLAEIHENGITIVQQMTDKQRKFLHAMLPKQPSTGPGTGIIVIHIPARPVIGNTFESQRPLIPERFLKRLIRILDGLLGGG